MRIHLEAIGLAAALAAGTARAQQQPAPQQGYPPQQPQAAPQQGYPPQQPQAAPQPAPPVQAAPAPAAAPSSSSSATSSTTTGRATWRTWEVRWSSSGAFAPSSFSIGAGWFGSAETTTASTRT